ncbi:ParB N-terminal domain-containing protein [Acidithiobacillus ferrivorans]|nr:ParB N-terminal domain-containing protein [Acidithiobacillus ferrivorans]
MEFIKVEISKLYEDVHQPRKILEDVEAEATLESLALSIFKHGVLQAILITGADEGGRHKIIAGERRYLASKLALDMYKNSAEGCKAGYDFNCIPAVISNEATEDHFYIQLIENLQRKDLEAHEVAQAINVLMADGMSESAIADALHKSRGYVQYYRFMGTAEYAELFDLYPASDGRVLMGIYNQRKKTGAIEHKITGAMNLWLAERVGQKIRREDFLSELEHIRENTKITPRFGSASTASGGSRKSTSRKITPVSFSVAHSDFSIFIKKLEAIQNDHSLVDSLNVSIAPSYDHVIIMMMDADPKLLEEDITDENIDAFIKSLLIEPAPEPALEVSDAV